MSAPTLPKINVTPPGYNYSPEAVAKAAAAGKFLHVGGEKSVTKRTLSGAPGYWNSDDPDEQRIIYIAEPAYRLTGTPEQVAQSLRYRSIGPAEIQRVIDNAITRDNYNTTKAKEVEVEMAKAEAAKTVKPKKPAYTLENCIYFASKLDQAKILSKGASNGAGVAVSGGKRGNRSASLAQRLAKLGPNKVLDVSAIDMQTGSGAVPKPTPGENARSGKYGTNNIPIISNNLEKYRRAIELAYGAQGLQTYAGDIDLVASALASGGRAPAAAVVSTPSPVIPGATLAVAPTIGGFPVMQ